MPQVHVYRDPEKVSDEQLEHIVLRLRDSVAKVLSVPRDYNHGDRSLELTIDDISVHVTDANKFDYGHKPLEVTIFAWKHPYRMMVGDSIAGKLATAIHVAVPTAVVTPGFIQVLLTEMSFAPTLGPVS